MALWGNFGGQLEKFELTNAFKHSGIENLFGGPRTTTRRRGNFFGTWQGKPAFFRHQRMKLPLEVPASTTADSLW